MTNVVHDAARDLLLNTANKTVYTNFYGGVWSFMRASSYTGARSLMPSVRYRVDAETDASGANFNPPRNNLQIYWERGPAKDKGQQLLALLQREPVAMARHEDVHARRRLSGDPAGRALLPSRQHDGRRQPVVFIYDWYWYGGRPFLEDALNKGFLGASNNGKMKFFIMWANHDVGEGWDMNPRLPANCVMPTVLNSTPAKFAEALRRAKDWTDRNARDGMPKLITINSWNEWTEGSYLEPDTHFKFGYLEAIKEVFSKE